MAPLMMVCFFSSIVNAVLVLCWSAIIRIRCHSTSVQAMSMVQSAGYELCSDANAARVLSKIGAHSARVFTPYNENLGNFLSCSRDFIEGLSAEKAAGANVHHNNSIEMR